jgi:hypothetical protein
VFVVGRYRNSCFIYCQYIKAGGGNGFMIDDLEFGIDNWVFTYFLKYLLLMLESDHVYE